MRGGYTVYVCVHVHVGHIDICMCVSEIINAAELSQLREHRGQNPPNSRLEDS